jgi:putative transposase
MKTSRFTDSQIPAILKQAESGLPVSELCREHGMSSTTFYKWRTKYGGMDTTFIRIRQGWLFLAVMIDLFSRSVIGWSMGKNNNAQLVQDALTMAHWRRGRKASIFVHSDQGSTHSSGGYQRLLPEKATTLTK